MEVTVRFRAAGEGRNATPGRLLGVQPHGVPVVPALILLVPGQLETLPCGRGTSQDGLTSWTSQLLSGHTRRESAAASRGGGGGFCGTCGTNGMSGSEEGTPDRAHRGCESSAGTLNTCFSSCAASCGACQAGTDQTRACGEQPPTLMHADHPPLHRLAGCSAPRPQQGPTPLKNARRS